MAYARSDDPLFAAADRFLRTFRESLVTVSPVVVETCFFLSSQGKRHLLDWVGGGSVPVVDVPVSSYPDLSATIAKYSRRDIDLADAALIWLAEQSGFRRILTTDVTDFSIFRLKGGKRFELIEWF